MADINNLQPIQNLKPFTKFCCSIGAIPSSYLVSLTYEEQLLWLCDYLQNTVIPTVNNNADAVTELQNLYVQLKNYVDNYFTNLDVQNEINNKLDEMAGNGTLTVLLQPFLNQYNTQLQSLTEEVNTYNESIENLENRVNNIINNGEATEGNTELIDIRNQFNGITAATAGQAVRNQAQGLANGTLIENNAIHKINLNNDIFKEDVISQSNINMVSPNNVTALNLVYLPTVKNINVKITGEIIRDNSIADSRIILYKNDSPNYVGTALTNEIISGKFSIEQNIELTAGSPYLCIQFRNASGTYKQFNEVFRIINPHIYINNVEVFMPLNVLNSTNYPDAENEVFLTGKEASLNKTTLTNYLENSEIIKRNIIEVNNAQSLVQALNDIATSTTNNKANKSNIYDIYLASGNYELYPYIDKTNLQDQTLYKRGIEIPDYVNLYGIGDVTISCTIPSGVDPLQGLIISTINTYGENHFKNIKFISNNARYCVHDDDGGAYKNRTISFENCTFTHNGNTLRPDVSDICYGAGYTGGRKGIFKNCIFNSKLNYPFYVHNSTPYYMTDKLNVEINNCVFNTNNENCICFHDAYNSLTGNVSINNSILNKKLYFKGTNPFVCFGGGNNNFDVTNESNTPTYITK